MITSLVVTGGNARDGKQFPKLVEKDEEHELPVDTYAADRGYDNGENHYLLETLKMHFCWSVIRWSTSFRPGPREGAHGDRRVMAQTC